MKISVDHRLNNTDEFQSSVWEISRYYEKSQKTRNKRRMNVSSGKDGKIVFTPPTHRRRVLGELIDSKVISDVPAEIREHLGLVARYGDFTTSPKVVQVKPGEYLVAQGASLWAVAKINSKKWGTCLFLNLDIEKKPVLLLEGGHFKSLKAFVEFLSK